MKLFAALNHLWDGFVEWLDSIGEDIMDFVKPLAKEMAKAGGKLLIESARDAVIAAEASGGSGSAKLQAARDAVVAKLEAGGMPIVMNAINGAIEAAVAQMKNENT